MQDSTHFLEPRLLRHFVPFNALSQPVLDELVSQIEISSRTKGQAVFQQGDNDPWLYFLLDGQILCQQHGREPRSVQAGSEDARHALARTQPRACTAIAATDVRLFRVNESLLEGHLGLDQATAYEVFEYDGSDDPDWMIQILANPTFRKVPPAHANAMFARFEPQPCKAGEVIIRQDDAPDYYYLIRAGRAQVTRIAPGGPTQMLAELGVGEGFGEEALLTGFPRNATVTMMSDGLLMRLSRQNFDMLLKPPLVKWVDLESARVLLREGAQLLDVRLEDEYREGSLRNSLNLPLYLLRLKARLLDPNKKYVLFCQHEQRSSAAAFLLAQRGLDAYVLRGGLSALMPGEDSSS